jgi:hypothetical protein
MPSRRRKRWNILPVLVKVVAEQLGHAVARSVAADAEVGKVVDLLQAQSCRVKGMVLHFFLGLEMLVVFVVVAHLLAHLVGHDVAKQLIVALPESFH